MTAYRTSDACRPPVPCAPLISEEPAPVVHRPHRRSLRRRAGTPALQPLEPRLLMARVQGIDVSHWQGNMNWATAYNVGDRFAFIKATQGTTIVDPQFVNNRTAAKNAGLLVGFYHFATPDSITDANGDGRYDDAVAEADWFYANAAAYMAAGYLRPVLDMEGNPGGLSNPQLSKFTNDFCSRIQELTGGQD